MQQYQNVLQDRYGNVIAGATVAVYIYGTLTGAAIYTGNNTGLLPSNTVVTNSLGEFSFYAANGRYSLFISATEYAAENYSDFILFDPADHGSEIVSFTPASGISATTVQNAIIEVSGDVDTLRNDLAASSGSSLVGYLPSYSGAVATTVQGRLRAADYNTELYAVAPPTPPTAGINATAGNLNGTYYYAVTYITASGETEGSVASNAVSPVNQQVNLTNVPVSSDSAVIGRRIYRTVANPSDAVLSKFVATINNNTATTYTDNLADGSLGADIPRSNTTGGAIELNGAVIGQASNSVTRFGQQAQPSNTGGYANSAFGFNALKANTVGYRNTALGGDALFSNTTGFNNTGVGVHALNDNLIGYDNTAVGYSALFTSKADSNTAVGSFALSSTTSGGSNVAVGAAALQLTTTGSGNCSVGTHSLWATGAGSGNTAVGFYAGSSLNGGNFNTYIGYQAGVSGVGVSSNTAVGFFGLFNNISGTGNVTLGSAAGYWETNSNKLWIDNQTRTDLSDARVKALVYGGFDTSPATQFFTVNGELTAAAGLGATVTPTKTADYTMTAADTAVTFNGSASITLTLLTGSNYVGRFLMLRNIAAFTVVSASSNVVPLAGGAAGTAILAATAGKWALLQYDGTNWTILMAN